MALNGVRVGLRDIYYATLTSDGSSGAVYAAPVQIVGAISANINPNSSIETLYGDDGPLDTASQLGQISLEMNVADLTLSQQAVLLGHTAPSNGVMIKKAADTPPWLAIGFKSKKSNGKYRYIWLLKGKFSQPELAHETQGDAVNFQTPTITGNFVKREYDDGWIKMGDEDETGGTNIGTTWFTDGPDSP